MADYCKQCSIELFNEDFRDFDGLISEEQVLDGQGALVVCEGCGPTLVDHEGKCIALCLKKDDKDHHGN